jgi:hypothetical protein
MSDGKTLEELAEPLPKVLERLEVMRHFEILDNSADPDGKGGMIGMLNYLIASLKPYEALSKREQTQKKRIDSAIEILRSMDLAPNSANSLLKLIEQRLQVLTLLEGEL